MAAFTWPDPNDRDAFDPHWDRVRKAASVVIRTIEFDSRVAGYVLAHDTDTVAEISYWIDPGLWGWGIASTALSSFLNEFQQRPIRARVAQDNQASIRVLEKCGFRITSENSGFANARGEETAEYLLELTSVRMTSTTKTRAQPT